jgi:hypothetical protein
MTILKVPSMYDPLIPISQLALDLPAPGPDWATYLRNRGIEVTVDDVGRPSVSRAVVKQLIQEKKDADARAYELAARRDAEFEAQRLATLRPGVPWWKLDGATPAEAMLMAAKAAEPQSTVPSAGEWMFGDYEVGGTFDGSAGE